MQLGLNSAEDPFDIISSIKLNFATSLQLKYARRRHDQDPLELYCKKTNQIQDIVFLYLG